MTPNTGWLVPASADPYGYPNPGYIYDSTDQYYCFDGTVAFGNIPEIQNAMEYLDDSTSVYDVYSPACGTSTDQVWIEQNLEGSYVFGYSPCARYKPLAVCDQAWVIYSPPDHYEAAYACGGNVAYQGNLIVTMRHELGHTVGLSHAATVGTLCGPVNGYAVDAMVSDWIVGNTFAFLDYNSHHVDHINCRCS